MRVCLTTSKGDWSNVQTGKSKFTRRLLPELNKLGVEITDDHTKCDIDLQYIRHHWKPRAKSILRLGPAHFDRTDFKWHNRRMWDSLKHADGVIYQSGLSKKFSDSFVGKPDCKRKVIFNGASPAFYQTIERQPKREREYDYNVLCSTRSFTDMKRLRTVVKSFFLADIPHSCLWIAGKTDGKIDRYLKDPPHPVKLLGILDDEKLGWYYRMVDVVINLCYLDACPNTIIEAICAHTPVIVNNLNGAAEFATSSVINIDEPFDWKPRYIRKPPKVDKDKVAQALHKRIYEPTLEEEWVVDIANIAKQYHAFFEEVLNG